LDAHHAETETRELAVAPRISLLTLGVVAAVDSTSMRLRGA